MTQESPLRVAVIGETSLRERLRAAAQLAPLVLMDGASTTSAVPVDCLVSDRPWDELPVESQQAIEQHQLAWVAVGCAAPKSYALPADATPRELALACRLMAENVRLRRQIGAAARERELLNAEARTDALTGVLNRRAWDEMLSPRLAQCRTAGQPACLAIFDIDQFKPINEQHGHAAGDELLRTCAAALRGTIRQHDLLCRLGGDEFGLLLVGLSAESARIVIERLRAAHAAALHGTNLPMATISAGYRVLAAGETIASGQLVEAADEALRRAKRAGRNRSVAAI